MYVPFVHDIHLCTLRTALDYRMPRQRWYRIEQHAKLHNNLSRELAEERHPIDRVRIKQFH